MSEPFFKCHEFNFQTVDTQPERFIAALAETDRAKLEVACRGVANSFADKSPPVRSRLVRGAKLHDLFAIYIDWPRSPGPTRLLLARRVGTRVLVARAFADAAGDIPVDEVKRAERALARVAADDGGAEGGN
ncbi:MAG TPA: hypothetical protein VN522_01345 [Solirubrobacterales bacterium]|nr:hypothetical protein [Solirubrobacterales bacterium]